MGLFGLDKYKLKWQKAEDTKVGLLDHMSDCFACHMKQLCTLYGGLVAST